MVVGMNIISIGPVSQLTLQIIGLWMDYLQATLWQDAQLFSSPQNYHSLLTCQLCQVSLQQNLQP